MTKTKGCLDCETRNVPECYATCERYRRLKEDEAAKKAYLRDARNRAYDYEHAHVDAARKKKRRKHK